MISTLQWPCSGREMKNSAHGAVVICSGLLECTGRLCRYWITVRDTVSLMLISNRTVEKQLHASVSYALRPAPDVWHPGTRLRGVE